MSLWKWYQTGFTATIVTAMLSVLLGGEMPGVLWCSPVLVLAMTPARIRGQHLPPWCATVGGITAIGWGLWVLGSFGMAAAVLAGGVALLVITLTRVLTAETVRHDGQALLLTLLLVFSGSVLHTEVSFGLTTLVYSVTMVWALVLRQLVIGAEEEAARLGGTSRKVTLSRRDIVTPRFLGAVALLSVFIVFATSVLFVMFPRVGLRNLGLFSRNSGAMPGLVSLQDRPRGEIASGAVVARVHGVPFPVFEGGLYLRGPVYDELLASGFTRSNRIVPVPSKAMQTRASSGEFLYEIFAHPLGLSMLPSLGPVADGRVLQGGQSNPSLRLKIRGTNMDGTLVTNRMPTGPVRYRLRGGIEHAFAGGAVDGQPTAELPTDMAHFLVLPQDLDGRVIELAKTLVQDAASIQSKVRGIRSFLRTQFSYTLDQPNRNASDPLAAFLFKDRRGHCEYFATAFAALLRAGGIHSRVVGGFQGGLWDEDSDIIVFTGKHAHVWVEWYEAGVGWHVDDATPLAGQAPGFLSGAARFYEQMSRLWDDYVVEYGLREQFNFFTEVFVAVGRSSRNFGGWPMQLMVGVSMLAFVLLLVWRYQDRIFGRGPGRDELGHALELALQRLRESPVPMEDSLREAASGFDEDFPVLQEALCHYERSRFGGVLRSQSETRRLIRELRRVRKVA